MVNKKLPDYIGYSRRNDETGYACAKSGCQSDHDAFYIREDLATCTVEERAVLDAVLEWRKDTMVDVPLIEAVDALLATKRNT